MNTRRPMQSAPIAGLHGGRRDGTIAALAPQPEPRGPVLPQRGASRQLELPFTAQPPLPRHSLRTG